MKYCIFLIFFKLFYLICYSQKNKDDDLDFFLDKIQKVYVGYNDKVKKKEFEGIVKKIKNSDLKDTLALFSKLTLYFKDKHLVLYKNRNEKEMDSLQCSRDSTSLVQYLNNPINKKDDYEGYWLGELNDYVIGIKKISKTPLMYKGYVVESRSKLIAGYCIFSMTKSSKFQFLTDYRDRRSRWYTKSTFKSPQVLIVDSYGKWKKINNYHYGMLNNIAEFSFNPLFKIIDKNTVLLTMPDFASRYVKVIDSLIKSNDDIMSNTKTLILDIRNNMGGNVRSYFSILPYIYTQPIVHSGGYRLCSEYVINDLKKNINDAYIKGDTNKAVIYDKYLNRMLAHKGRLLFSPGDTLAHNLDIKKFPQNIAIIINNACLSSAELMILDFKQSSKVKLFGEPTGGAVDYLDVKVIDFPSKQYTLYVPTTKRALTSSQQKFDIIGIKPDVEISDDINDWIEFVRKYYEKN